MKALTKFLISGTILAGGSGATWKAYDTFVPKTVGEWFEWKELDKVDTNLEARSIFIEHKESWNDAGIEGVTTNTEIKQAATKIKEWCEEQFLKISERKEWNKIVKYCQFKPTKVKSFLASKDETDFITDDSGYKVSAFLLKHVNNTWKTKVKTGSEKVSYSELKTWCEKELAKKLHKDSNLYSVVNKFCKVQSPTLKTIEDQIKTKNSDWNMESEGDTDKWKKKFERWKNTPKVIELLTANGANSGTTKDTSDTDGGPKLKDWCKEGKDKPLSEDIEDSFVNHIKAVCTNKTEESAT